MSLMRAWPNRSAGSGVNWRPWSSHHFSSFSGTMGSAGGRVRISKDRGISFFAGPGFALVLFLFGASLNQAGAQSSFTVLSIGTTSTQAIIAYTAGIDDACAIEVSELAGYTPPVHDVDSNLFPQSNLDSRQGSLVSGWSRVMVI